MGKFIWGFVIAFVVVFSVGFISGYFLDRSSIAYTSSELQELKVEMENLQLQELFISGEESDCKLMYSSMGSLSYDLYSLVNRLKATSPENPEFHTTKRDADFLSLKAWIVARNIKAKCTEGLMPILFMYSGNCPECEEQDQALQTMKSKHQETVLVYAIDYSRDEPATKLVKDAFEIDSTPSMVINHKVYGKLGLEELEDLYCQEINCTAS